MTDAKLPQNPLPGDENMQICILRQTNRKVPLPIAQQVCMTLSTVLGANALKDADVVLVPAVFTAEGVHNGRYKPWAAIRNAAPTLMGVPFFINQPGEHEDGAVPPVDDKSTHHGFVAQVNVDHARRRLTGLVALYTPEFLQRNGFTEARVNFQAALLKAIDQGFRAAISTSFLARVNRTPGQFGNKKYTGIEERLVFNGLSIVPLGAEDTALMNGLPLETRGTKDSEMEVIEQGFNALIDPSNQPDSIEHSNTLPEQSGSTDMDEAALRSMSIPALVPLNTEVARLANEHTQSQRDLASANKRAEGLDSQIKALQKDAEATGLVLANLLSKDDADAILAKATDNASLASQVKGATERIANELGEVRKAKAEGATKRIEAAKKALSNVMKAADVALFEDAKDLELTANRLETLARQRGTKRVTPATPLANVSSDLEVEEDGEDEASANGYSAEFQGLLDLYELPGANARSKAGEV